MLRMVVVMTSSSSRLLCAHQQLITMSVAPHQKTL